MGLQEVIDIMGQNKAVTLGHVSYALIDGRICVVKFGLEEDGETETVTFADVAFSVNEFAMFCERFNPSREGAYRDLPEKRQILSEDGVYDFTKVPKHECTNCTKIITAENCLKDGKYGLCPYCGNQFYRASRVDGKRETDFTLETGEETGEKKTRSVFGTRKKIEKPVPPTVEEALSMMESGKIETAKPRRSRLSINVS